MCPKVGGASAFQDDTCALKENTNTLKQDTWAVKEDTWADGPYLLKEED